MELITLKYDHPSVARDGIDPKDNYRLKKVGNEFYIYSNKHEVKMTLAKIKAFFKIIGGNKEFNELFKLETKVKEEVKEVKEEVKKTPKYKEKVGD